MSQFDDDDDERNFVEKSEETWRIHNEG
jgi:hypothetical protein